MNEMELIRKAVNSDGDYVSFQRWNRGETVAYRVYVYNRWTARIRTEFSAEVSLDFVSKNFERAVLAAGMEVFKDACLFMEIESGLDEEKGDS